MIGLRRQTSGDVQYWTHERRTSGAGRAGTDRRSCASLDYSSEALRPNGARERTRGGKHLNHSYFQQTVTVGVLVPGSITL